MLASSKKSLRAAFIIISLVAISLSAHAQSAGNSTSVTGTVLDPTGAGVVNATADLHTPVSGFRPSTSTDRLGKFVIPNVPFNPYHLKITAQGFGSFSQDVDVRSVVP